MNNNEKLMCFRCIHFTERKESKHESGYVVGLCDQYVNIGEFNNAIYYRNDNPPQCYGLKFKES